MYKDAFNIIKLRVNSFHGGGTSVPFYGTEVPSPEAKKILRLMVLKGISNNKE